MVPRRNPSSKGVSPAQSKTGIFSHFGLNSSRHRIFGHFGQLGGPDFELFDNFQLDRRLFQIATSLCQLQKIYRIFHKHPQSGSDLYRGRI